MRTTIVVRIHRRTISYTLNIPPLQTSFEEHNEGLAVLVSISDELILIISGFDHLWYSKIWVPLF